MISFENTEIAFSCKSNSELKKAKLLFTAFNYPTIVKYGPPLTSFILNIPVLSYPIKSLIRNTIYEHFCGGESIEGCDKAIEKLWNFKIGTILDYSVEGEEKESVFETTCKEIINTIEKAGNNSKIPFSVFKTTGIARFHLLEKITNGLELNELEKEEFGRVKERFELICSTAAKMNVKILVDAEETWIQKCIDDLTMQMMEKFNQNECIVFNTLQMYRTDRLQYLKDTVSSNSFKMGFKLVRGAYMEKERLRATEMNYVSPIHPDKDSCDKDYNSAVNYCLDNISNVSIMAGTHNENSSMLLVKRMQEMNLSPNDGRIYFSQLLGMSDHISFNLAKEGYNVAKYMPYGPISSVLPYLSRRAQENSSVKGQAGRELSLIKTELRRRKIL